MKQETEITKERLEELYLEKGFGSKVISDILKMNRGKVRGLLLKFKIPIRKSSGRSFNLVGQKFNMLTVTELCEERVNRQRIWKCLCECGGFCKVQSFELRRGVRKSCGCLHFKCGKESPRWKGHEEISNVFFLSVLRGAKSRNLEFDISIEDVWDQFIKQDRKCALSGIELKFKRNHKEKNTASLDRIDSLKGYTVDNIQLVHKDLNIMKQAHSQKKFIDYCKLVAKHHG